MDEVMRPGTTIETRRPSLHHRNSAACNDNSTEQSQYGNGENNSPRMEPVGQPVEKNTERNGCAGVDFNQRTWGETQPPIDPALIHNGMSSSMDIA